MRKCVGLDRQRAPERVLSVISELDADVIAVQEADFRLGERPTAIPHDFIEKYTDMVPVALGGGDVSLGWHGNAVLVRKGARVTAAERLLLPHLEPRGAVLIEFEHKDRSLRLVATHLGLTRSFRRRQLRAIAADLRRRAAMPTVILGDFNEWSHRRGLEPLLERFEVHAPGRSFHAARPVAALDRIATSRDIALADAAVHERGAALKASDHLPVWADLLLPAA
ncbi:MAG TPA: endonuclease/exonuclease/phosphatase family protein [Devosiaceae bacterium]|nr:endonuclease/exonuclease/phosphatase family protein [Devosiaceae bacterium]